MKQIFNGRFWLRASMILPIIIYVFLWIFSLLILMHLKEHPSGWFWEIIRYIKNIKGGMIGLYVLMFMAGGLIISVLRKYSMLFLRTLFKILFYPAYIPYLWVARIFANDKRVPIFEALEFYKSFLRRYYQRNSISGIIKTHGRFIPFIFWREFPRSGIYRSFLVCPFEFISKLEFFQTELSDEKHKELFIKDFEMDNFLITFSIIGGGTDAEDIIKRMKGRFVEIKRKLPGVDSGIEYKLEEPKVKSDHVAITIKRSVRWEPRKFDFLASEKNLPNGSLLLGFTPDNGTFKDLQIPLKSTLHSMIVAETGAGKDVTTRSILWSILEGIRRGLPYELHLFDSKGDWLPFRNMEEYGIYLYENPGEYATITTKYVEDMRIRNELIGMSADMDMYLDSHKGSDLKYRFIFINEFSSLYGLLEKENQKAFHSNLNVLFSQSRSAGYRMTLILQTARGSGKSENTIRQLSLNIGTTISGVIKDEIEAGMISQQFRKRLVSLEKHNFCLIQKGECTEFRSYHSEKPDMMKWLTEVFTPDMKKKTGNVKEKESEKILIALLESPKVKEFLEDAREIGKLSKERAMIQFNLSEPTFRKLASALLTLGEIQSEVGKGYFFPENDVPKNPPSE